MASVKEIRVQVRRWLDGEISFREFEDWFVPSAGSIGTEGDQLAESMIDDIDMSLSEYSDGVLTRSDLRAELEKAIRPFVPVRFVIVASRIPQKETISLKPRGPVMAVTARADSETESLLDLLLA